MESVRTLRRDPGQPRRNLDVAMAGNVFSSAADGMHLRQRGIQAGIPVKEDQKGR